MNVRAVIFVLFCFLSQTILWSQSRTPSGHDYNNIHLTNPSFEDIARASVPPRGWVDCGFPTESAPDVQPSGAWEVYRPAHQGRTYLGMVTRENDTWESVGQRLVKPLLRDECYTFSIYLCSSSEYWSAVVPDSLKRRELTTDVNLPEKNFNQAIKLRIWGGDAYCARQELLAESSTVSNTFWQKYSWKINPTQNDVTHIVLEAFYKTPTLFPYNGNILLDHASPFTIISCSEDEPLILPPAVSFIQPIEKINPRANQVKVSAQVQNIFTKDQIKFSVNGRNMQVFDYDYDTHVFSTVLYLKEGKNNLLIQVENEEGKAKDETSVYIIEKGSQKPPEEVATTTEPKPKESEYKIMPTLGDKSFKEGQIIKLERLYFQADSTTLGHDGTSDMVLNEIFNFLQENPNVKIEVGGHTSGGSRDLPINLKFSDELSKARAKTVATYLIDKGIETERITYKGYGPRKPLASNETYEGRVKNQRVEIKILSTNG